MMGALKMIKKYCDKCHNEMEVYPSPFSFEEIFDLIENNDVLRIHLCKKCLNKLKKWVKKNNGN